MWRLLLAILAAASLSGCICHDYTRKVHLNQLRVPPPVSEAKLVAKVREKITPWDYEDIPTQGYTVLGPGHYTFIRRLRYWPAFGDDAISVSQQDGIWQISCSDPARLHQLLPELKPSFPKIYFHEEDREIVDQWCLFEFAP